MQSDIAEKTQETKTDWKTSIKNYFHNLLDIRGDMMSYEEIDTMMQENTIIHGSNMWILILAMLIASIGLYNDAPAIIIGAMLISPLMNGILTWAILWVSEIFPCLGRRLSALLHRWLSAWLRPPCFS